MSVGELVGEIEERVERVESWDERVEKRVEGLVIEPRWFSCLLYGLIFETSSPFPYLLSLVDTALYLLGTKVWLVV